MQLFDSAARYSDRFPMSGAGAFIKEIVQEDIAGDVITAKVHALILLKFLPCILLRVGNGKLLQLLEYKMECGQICVSAVRS